MDPAERERHRRVATALEQVASMKVMMPASVRHWRRRRRIGVSRETAQSAEEGREQMGSEDAPFLDPKEEDTARLETRLTNATARVKLLLLAVAALNARDDVDALGDPSKVLRVLHTMEAAEEATPSAQWREPDQLARGLAAPPAELGGAPGSSGTSTTTGSVASTGEGSGARRLGAEPSALLRHRVASLRGRFRGAATLVGAMRRASSIWQQQQHALTHVERAGGDSPKAGASQPIALPAIAGPAAPQSPFSPAGPARYRGASPPPARAAGARVPPTMSGPLLRAKAPAPPTAEASVPPRRVSFADLARSEPPPRPERSPSPQRRDAAARPLSAFGDALPSPSRWGGGAGGGGAPETSEGGGWRAATGGGGGDGDGDDDDDDDDEEEAPPWMLAGAESAVRRAESALLREDAEVAEEAVRSVVAAWRGGAASAAGSPGAGGAPERKQSDGARSLTALQRASQGSDSQRALEALEALERQLAKRVDAAAGRGRAAHGGAAAEAARGGGGGGGGGIPTRSLHKYLSPDLTEFVGRLRAEVDEVMQPADEILRRRRQAARKRLGASIHAVSRMGKAAGAVGAGRGRRAEGDESDGRDGADRVARRMCFAWMRMLRQRHAAEGRGEPFGRADSQGLSVHDFAHNRERLASYGAGGGAPLRRGDSGDRSPPRAAKGSPHDKQARWTQLARLSDVKLRAAKSQRRRAEYESFLRKRGHWN